MKITAKTAELPATKRKLVDAGVKLMRLKGYNATTVDDICHAAEVTKGAFFHYFKSKDELAKAAAQRFRERKGQESHEAAFRKLSDPLDRVFGRLDFVVESFGGAGQVTKGCLLGTFAQELSFTHAGLRTVCQESFLKLAGDFEKDLAEAQAAHSPNPEFDPRSLAMLYLSIIQGSLLLAKAAESNGVLRSNVEQFRRYLESLFGRPRRSGGYRSPKITSESLK
jgi:TetR/AcrR family transcriptional repressor of nem operon